MENSELSQLFSACGKAILIAAHNERLTEDQRMSLLNGRDALMGFINELSATPRGKESATKAMVRRSMAHVHPRTDYSFAETLVRDLADVCVSFRRLAEAGHHRDHAKSIDAKYLCDTLVDELTPD